MGVQECEYIPHRQYNSVEADLFDAVTRHLGEGYCKVAGAISVFVRVRVSVYAHFEPAFPLIVAVGLCRSLVAVDSAVGYGAPPVSDVCDECQDAPSSVWHRGQGDFVLVFFTVIL